LVVIKTEAKYGRKHTEYFIKKEERSLTQQKTHHVNSRILGFQLIQTSTSGASLATKIKQSCFRSWRGL